MARSKEFEVNTVLDKAMTTFWRQGYEKTSIQELVTNMGIHRRSLYDTFGDKHDLFMGVMSRYKTLSHSNINYLVDQSTSIKQAIRKLFELPMCLDTDNPKGCLMVNSAVELAMHDSEVAAAIHEEFLDAEKLLYELIVRGQQTGEIASHHDAASLALLLNNAWVGFRVMVKTTTDTAKLDSIIEITLATLN